MANGRYGESWTAAKGRGLTASFDGADAQGLSRHDAVHAIGAVVAQMIYELLHQKDSVQTSHARYYAAIERLTAAQWRAGSQG